MSSEEVIIYLCAPVSLHLSGDGYESIAVYQVQQHGAGATFPNAIVNNEGFRCEHVKG